MQRDHRGVGVSCDVVKEETGLLESVEFGLGAFDHEVGQVAHHDDLWVAAPDLGVCIDLIEHVLIGDL